MIQSETNARKNGEKDKPKFQNKKLKLNSL